MYRKPIYPLMLTAAAVVMFVTSTPLRASEADDERIVASFKESYVYRMYLKDDSVAVEAKDGVLTLSGTVAEESHKILAEELTAGVPGIIRVDNQLETTAEAAAEVEQEDIWLARKVKLTLLFHRNVSAANTDVQVNAGIVTLKGEASSGAQKELTTEYAADIEGVTAVKNEMTVAASPKMEERTEDEKIDDASVTAVVKTALLTHRSTSSIRTKVETRNGEVTLTGIARNAAEKSLVTKLVSDIHGVSSVNNEMTVGADTTK